MIVVDSSVWIDHLRDARTPAVLRLRERILREQLIVGDLIICEVLRGVQSEAQARRIEAILRRFHAVSLCNSELAVEAARNYRLLRARGITIRKTIDLIVGTFCIEHTHSLLHSDRDFEPMERYLGLQTV